MSEQRVTIAQLPDASNPDGTEVFPVFQSGATGKLTINHTRRMRDNPTPVVASGTDQAGAFQLDDTFWVHTLGTVPANSGVKFAALSSYLGVEDRYIINPASTGQTCLVYPPVGGKINDELVNAGVGIEAGVVAHFIRISAVNLRSIG